MIPSRRELNTEVKFWRHEVHSYLCKPTFWANDTPLIFRYLEESYQKIVKVFCDARSREDVVADLALLLRSPLKIEVTNTDIEADLILIDDVSNDPLPAGRLERRSVDRIALFVLTEFMKKFAESTGVEEVVSLYNNNERYICINVARVAGPSEVVFDL